MQDYLDQIKWNEAGLVAAIAQDHLTGEVLMMAWMNRESLASSIREQRAVYWSRSRQQLWRKGESSGHEQVLKSVALDCDGDALLLAVEQKGDIACHTGRRSCFYRELRDGQWQTTQAAIKDPGEIYK